MENVLCKMFYEGVQNIFECFYFFTLSYLYVQTLLWALHLSMKFCVLFSPVLLISF